MIEVKSQEEHVRFQMLLSPIFRRRFSTTTTKRVCTTVGCHSRISLSGSLSRTSSHCLVGRPNEAGGKFQKSRTHTFAQAEDKSHFQSFFFFSFFGTPGLGLKKRARILCKSRMSIEKRNWERSPRLGKKLMFNSMYMIQRVNFRLRVVAISRRKSQADKISLDTCKLRNRLNLSRSRWWLSNSRGGECSVVRMGCTAGGSLRILVRGLT